MVVALHVKFVRFLSIKILLNRTYQYYKYIEFIMKMFILKLYLTYFLYFLQLDMGVSV